MPAQEEKSDRPCFHSSDCWTAASTCQENSYHLKQTSLNHYVHRAITPSPSISFCVCLFLSFPSPSSSSHPLLHHAGRTGLPENKQQSVERGKAEGGRYVEGEQRMFLSFLCPSGYCRPHCSPSWGNWAHVTLAGPWAHTCCLVRPVWRSPAEAPHTRELQRCSCTETVESTAFQIIIALASRMEARWNHMGCISVTQMGSNVL